MNNNQTTGLFLVPGPIDPATKYCVGAPSIPAFFAGMGGKEFTVFLPDQ
jgi:hypothetical protein